MGRYSGWPVGGGWAGRNELNGGWEGLEGWIGMCWCFVRLHDWIATGVLGLSMVRWVLEWMGTCSVLRVNLKSTCVFELYVDIMHLGNWNFARDLQVTITGKTHNIFWKIRSIDFYLKYREECTAGLHVIYTSQRAWAV